MNKVAAWTTTICGIIGGITALFSPPSGWVVTVWAFTAIIWAWSAQRD
jgi:hypothetical protein